MEGLVSRGVEKGFLVDALMMVESSCMRFGGGARSAKQADEILAARKINIIMQRKCT